MARSDERGVALVMALLMVLAVSIITSSLLAVARTEAFSSLSYTSMSQVRYGAESGIHAAANHLLYGYAPPTVASATDPIANYDMMVSPVTYNGAEVMLSSDPDFPSNYPDPAARAAFIAASQGTLNVNTTSVGYTARATLMSMRVLTDYYTGLPVTLQTWEIVGIGARDRIGRLPGRGLLDPRTSGSSRVQLRGICHMARLQCAVVCGWRNHRRATTRALRSSEARPSSLNQTATSVRTATLTESVTRPRSTARSQRHAPASATARRTT